MENNALLFQLFDKVCYHCDNYYAEQMIDRIEILPGKVIYYTDTPSCFTNEDVGKTIFASFEEAKKYDKERG